MKAKLIGAAAVLAAVLLALSGCGGGSGGYGSNGGTSGGGYGTTTPAGPSAGASSSVQTVAGLKTAQTSLGAIVVSDTGMTVYQYTKDVKGAGTSACTGGCLKAWPPVLTTGDTPSLQGITGTVGTITANGGKQVTLNGLPLYYWASDAAPGDVTGQGVQGVWYVVAPDGSMVTTTK